MRNLLSILLVFCLSFSFVMNDAFAKRFGGGRSFGVQRSVTNRSYNSPNYSQPYRSNQPSLANRLLGPLAGLALGGLLAYLFLGHGLGAALLSWLVIFIVILLLWGLIRNLFKPKTPYTYSPRSGANHWNQANSQTHQENPFKNLASKYAGYSNTNNVQTAQYPIGFQADTFLREAKSVFIRLQAAYDSQNLQDLREFTTPQVFAEVRLQLQERGAAENITDVVKLDAELLDAAEEDQTIVASVQFSGIIREEVNAAPVNFTEIWHFKKSLDSNQWLVAGIEQR